MATYLVNNSAVNDRIDWRQRLVPGPLPRVEQGFPGEPGRFVTKGRVRPIDLIITGYLEAASFNALHDEILFWHGRQEWLSLFTVSIHGSTFSSLDLWDFDVIDREATAFSRGPTTLVRQRVRFHWRQLQE